MKFSILSLAFAIVITFDSCSQTSAKKKEINLQKTIIVGGGCEGCEAIYETPVPVEKLTEVDTLPDFNDAGTKIEISGIIYNADERTPANNVVLYVYHTDQNGKYATKGNETGWGKRHGYIRGWVKSDQNGFYKFYTLVPASYPNSKSPKHIHPVIKEADKNEYYIDEFLFDDDLYLTKEERNKHNPRGGNGVLKPYLKDGILRATRDIILGLNVPDYPVAKKANQRSGLSVGANCPAFDPLHLSGADKNKKVCPMCKYGYGQGLMVWFNHANLDQLKNFAVRLEKEMTERGEKKLRVFLVYMNPFYAQNDATGEEILQGKIKKWCEEQGLQKVAMVWVPSPVDKETCGVFNINPKVKNTVFVYKKRKVAAKWIDMDYDEEGINNILKKLDLPS